MKIDGVININKAPGWTSQDVCAKLRSRLHIKKIGHTGTLDPMASGVLPVCMGRATRMMEYYDADFKTYHAAMQLGMTSDTLDITGEILGTHEYSDVSEKAVREAFRAYRGEVEQLPPKYSALRVNGKRAYELAREGKDFELSTRTVTISRNEISSLDLEKGVIEFDVTCSKGTYVRTITDDIGRELGCGAVMTALERTASGCFMIEDAAGIEEICSMSDAELAARIIPVDRTLTALGMVLIDERRVRAFCNGNDSDPWGFRITEESSFRDLFRVYSRDRFLGVASVENGSLIPRKVMNADI